MNSPCNDAVKYAPVLERMVEILGSWEGERVSFGQAMDQASRELGIVVPLYMEAFLLTSAFQIISGGRLPGAPDA